MTTALLDEDQREAAAAMVRAIAKLPPPKRPAAVAIALFAIDRCGEPALSPTQEAPCADERTTKSR